MEQQIQAQITRCREMMDRYANKTGRGNTEQWMLWSGQLLAWRDALGCTQSAVHSETSSGKTAP